MNMLILEITLKDFTDIFELIKNIDNSAVIFVVSLLIPTFYITFKKLAATDASSTPKNLLERFASFITLPKIESWILFVSLGLFIMGIIQLKISMNYKEKVRIAGVQIKNYLLNENYYALSLDSIAKKLNIETNTIRELPYQYPSEFIILPSQSKEKSETLLLTDAVFQSKVILKSEALLDSYLNDQLQCPNYFANGSLLMVNSYFTHQVIEKTIIDSQGKYAIVKNNKEFGIKRLK